MTIKKIFLALALLLDLTFGSACTKNNKTTFSPRPLQVISYSPAIPIIKGLAVNPIVRLTINVPGELGEQVITSLVGSVSALDVNVIQQIDLFLTDAEPFNMGQPLATIAPTTSTFTIPVSMRLSPGVHFVWFSVVLKPTASIDGTIEILCNSLTTQSGSAVSVVKDNSNHVKRIAVAVRKANDDNVHTYRIPGIVQTDQGTLIAVYDNRYTKSGDLPGNIDVGMSRSLDSGKTWEPMRVVMDMGPPHDNNGVGDPAILFDPVTKKVWVAALWSKGNRSIAGSLPGISPDTTGQFVLVSSADDGLTWTAPRSITPEIKNAAWHLFFNGPGSGIAMRDGKIVFAAQYWNENKIPYSTLIYSDDHGNTWKGKLAGPKSNTTESQLVETTPGTILLNMRDNRGGYRSIATTSNMGQTWIEHPTSFSALPDPVCMASLIKSTVQMGSTLKDVLFFSNPSTTSGRYNITVKASVDLGESWKSAHQLLIDERNCFGYSSLTAIDSKTVGLLYEGSRDLYFIKIPVKDILKE
jgi:sialidase-1